LGAGAQADITVYTEQADKEAMFAKPNYVFKNGELVVKDGIVTKVVWGATHVTKPAFDIGVEADLKKYFDKYHTIQCDNFKISNDELLQDSRSKIITHTKGT
jgi:formylmethanofuran dehydrogenase subunit A